MKTICVGRISIYFWDALGRWHHKNYGFTKNPITALKWAEELNSNLKVKSEPWELYEVEYLIKTLPHSTVRSVAVKLERSLAEVNQVIKSLNLKEND